MLLIKDHAAGIKITNELFSVPERWFAENFNFGLDIFLDLKLLDVPNTVKTVASIESLKTVKYLTLHTSGGYDMPRSANEAAKELELWE